MLKTALLCSAPDVLEQAAILPQACAITQRRALEAYRA